MVQLPRTSGAQHHQLQNSPSHHSGIRTLALIPKLLLAFLTHQLPPLFLEPYPLKNLFPSNILQPGIQVLYPSSQTLSLIILRTINIPCLANHKVQMQFHMCGSKPSRTTRTSLKTEFMFPGLGGRKRETAGGTRLLTDYPVIIVEDFLLSKTHGMRPAYVDCNFDA